MGRSYDQTLLTCAPTAAMIAVGSVATLSMGIFAVPGASISVQTYGDFLNFNPHLHAIVSDGCFLDDGSFKAAPGFILEDLEEIFQYEVLEMLKKEGKINDAVIP